MSEEPDPPGLETTGAARRAISAFGRTGPAETGLAEIGLTEIGLAEAVVEARPVPAWAELLVRLLDHAFVIPGTRIPVGFDALVGLLVPVAGDVMGALATLSLLYLGFALRVPKVVLLRMVINVAVDALLGCVPALGDAFDLYFRAGERNLALLRRHSGAVSATPSPGDYLVVSAAVVVVLGLLSLPVVVALGLAHALWGVLVG